MQCQCDGLSLKVAHQQQAVLPTSSNRGAMHGCDNGECNDLFIETVCDSSAAGFRNLIENELIDSDIVKALDDELPTSIFRSYADSMFSQVSNLHHFEYQRSLLRVRSWSPQVSQGSKHPELFDTLVEKLL